MTLVKIADKRKLTLLKFNGYSQTIVRTFRQTIAITIYCWKKRAGGLVEVRFFFCGHNKILDGWGLTRVGDNFLLIGPLCC